MAWLILIVAGVFEVVWATAMKQSAGFTRPGPSIVTVATMLVSFALLGWSMRTLPLGTAYAVWTGVGAIGAVAVGIGFFGEAATPLRLLALAMIVGGIALLKIATP